MYDICYTDLLNFSYLNDDKNFDTKHYSYWLQVLPARKWWNFMLSCHGSIILDDEE